MRQLRYDPKTYHWGYALPYTLLQIFFLPGFLAAWYCIFAHISVKGSPWSGYLYLSFLGLIVVGLFKAGNRFLMKRSWLNYDSEIVIYNTLFSPVDIYTAFFFRLIMIMRDIETRQIYDIHQIHSVRENWRFYLIEGRITKNIQKGTQILSEEQIISLKIPKAFKQLSGVLQTACRDQAQTDATE